MRKGVKNNIFNIVSLNILIGHFECNKRIIQNS